MVELIDVESILKSKAKGKKPPHIAVWLLKRIIHQDEVNSFLREWDAERDGLDFVEGVLKMLDATYSLEGADNIDPAKRYIFVANHPLGGLDGMILGKLIGDVVGGNPRIRILVNDLLMFFSPLRSIFIPINKHGSQGKLFADAMHDVFSSDKQVFTFPAGACSRFNLRKMRIYDLEWKKMFINKAVQYERDVVPVYFKGRNSIFFYTLAFLRKSLGIKANIEMLFLSHEMYGNKHATFKARMGKPIAWQTFDKSKSPQQWAEQVKKIVYELRTKN